MNSAVFAIVMVALVACVAAQKMKAIAVIKGGDVYGNVTFSQSSCIEPGVYVEVNIVGLQPGQHGFHVHEKGDLSDGCLSTGGHYNPDKLTHGAPSDHIRHVGDLGNIIADQFGNAKTSFTDQVITLFGARSIVGRAVVVHAEVDDLGKSDHPDSLKTGNAGGRVGCGIIGISSPTEGDWPCQGKDACQKSEGGIVAISKSLISIITLTTLLKFADII